MEATNKKDRVERKALFHFYEKQSIIDKFDEILFTKGIKSRSEIIREMITKYINANTIDAN